MTNCNSKSNTCKLKAAAIAAKTNTASSFIKSKVHIKHEKKLKCDREKTRRDNINENFGKLMGLLLMLDPEVGGDSISGDLFATAIVPPKDLLPRANLLERACVTIRRLHLEKEHWKSKATDNYNDFSAKMQETSAIRGAPTVDLIAKKSRKNVSLENPTQVYSEKVSPHCSPASNSMICVKSPVITKSVGSNDQQQVLTRVKREQLKVQHQLQELQKQLQKKKLQKQLQQQQKKCMQQQSKQQLRQQLHHSRQLLKTQPKQQIQQQPKQQQEQPIQQIQQLLKHHLKKQQLQKQQQREQSKQRLLQQQPQQHCLQGVNNQEPDFNQPLQRQEQKHLQHQLQQELYKQILQKKQEVREKHQILQQQNSHDHQHYDHHQQLLIRLLMNQLQQNAKP